MAKVMYVEDEPAIAELVARKLQRLGHTVRLVSNGHAALRQAEAEEPDLILLDIGLGETSPDGWEVNRQLKERSATRLIPIIALTAAAHRADDHDRALREGFVEHLTKPLDFDQVLAAVAAALEQRGIS